MTWLEMWEYTSGEWYFGFAGEADRCPADELALPAASTPPAAQPALPDQQRLISRMEAFYNAILVKDARVMYQTQTPARRSEYSLETYQERGDMSTQLLLVVHRLQRVQYAARVCWRSCRPAMLLRSIMG